MAKKIKDSGFKLLAIRPLKGCNPKFLKALKEDKLYQFYNDYVFSYEDGDSTKKIVSVIHEPSIPSDLYKVGDLTINISALVGKNGSGKSSLIDLFFAVVYNFSMNRGILDVDARYKPEEQVLDKLRVQVIYELNDRVYILDTKSIEKDKDKLEISISNEVKSTPYTKQHKREFNINSIISNESDILKTLLNNLFYTVAVNYSVYSLNNRHIGGWINHLFHKNDGYKAPIVINPMRHEGNFDVNKELYLSKSRLLANIIHPDYIEKANTLRITEYQSIDIILFKVDTKKLSSVIYTTPDKLNVTAEYFYKWNGGKDTFLNKISSYFFDGMLNDYIKDVKYGENILVYIIRKLFKIALKYDSYRVFLKGEYPKLDNYDDSKIDNYGNFLKFNQFDDYLKLIHRDKSHITFKLRQAINYLINNPLRIDKNCIFHKAVGFKVTAKELSNRIKYIKSEDNIINLLPPSLFEVDFELVDDFGKKSEFNKLSSGEQQLIQSTQSLAYHLININSVFGKPKSDKRTTYDSVNLMLDEIELYFHPDTQRKYVKYLLDTIERLELDNISSINILLATHSPFVLSDIPVANTLRLRDKGEPSLSYKETETFGANLHDLLANDFFLENGFMGEFAHKYITDLIDEINKLDKNISMNLFREYIGKVDFIAEPFIKYKMIETLESKIGEYSDELNEIILRKEQELEELKSKRGHD